MGDSMDSWTNMDAALAQCLKYPHKLFSQDVSKIRGASDACRVYVEYYLLIGLSYFSKKYMQHFFL